MTRTARRGPADDTGASLVLSLALLAFLSLVIGSLLTYSATAVRGTRGTQARATQVYDVDGALQTAVNQIRTGAYNNDAGQTCPELGFPRAGGGQVRVTCTGALGTGGASENVPISTANKPGQAVLTLGASNAEAGIAQTSGGVLRIQGDVVSNGAITTGTGTLRAVNGRVIARGACSGTVTGTDAEGTVLPNTCSAPASAVPPDPGYAQPGAGLVYRPLPTCGSSSAVEFMPGYYDDAVGLSAMTSGTGACRGKTFHFQPAAGGGVGRYYFDFHNGEGGDLPTGSRVWRIDDRTAFVVGGTPRGWVPDASAPAGVPGTCVSPLSSATNGGVQFVFGGDSRIQLAAGSVELCGQYSASAPPIAVYGATSGADAVSGPTTLKTDGTGTALAGATFANPARITAVDGRPASVTIDATGSVLEDVTASILVKGFAPATPIPAGSILTSAKLVVVHRDNNADLLSRLKSLRVTATPSRTGAAALADVPQPTAYLDGPTGTAYHTDNLDLLGSLAKEVHDNGFAGLQVRYDATVGFLSRVTENLDAIQLVLAWKPPAVRGQQTAVDGAANCLGRHPEGCALLDAEPTDTRLSVQGTLYAPYAAVDLRLAKVSAAVFRSGLIVRTLRAGLTPAAGYTGALIEVPNDSAGPVPLEVYFRAYLSGRVVGTARARFPATDPSAPITPGRRDVVVLSWMIRRN